MIDIATAYTILTTVGTAAALYLWCRNDEILNLAKDVVNAYADKNISEEEYKVIVEDLGAIIYKK